MMNLSSIPEIQLSWDKDKLESELTYTEQVIIVPVVFKVAGSPLEYLVELIYGRSTLHWFANDIVHYDEGFCPLCDMEVEYLSHCFELNAFRGEINEYLADNVGNPVLRIIAPTFIALPGKPY
jgi:hypothetical protein